MPALPPSKSRLCCSSLILAFGICQMLAPRIVNAQCVTQILEPSTQSSGQYFGQSVGLTDEFAIIGAPGEDCVLGDDCGAAYILESDGTAWNFVQRIVPNVQEADALFGISVAIADETAVVGARHSSVLGTFSGQAYVYSRYDGGWTQDDALVGDDTDANDDFGTSVAIDGDLIVVGAERRNEDALPGYEGASYIFKRRDDLPTQWQQVRKLTADNAAGVLDAFGVSAAIDGNTVIVGAERTDELGTDSGSVYIFERNLGGMDAWGLSAFLTASDGSSGEHFGWAVDIHSDWVVVGATSRQRGGPGAVYVFRRDGLGAWAELDKLTASDGASFDNFGVSVSLSGDTLLVGAAHDDDHGISSGAAYLFRLIEDNWTEQHKLSPTSLGPEDFFGGSVDLGTKSSISGAHGNDDDLADAGLAYVVATGGSDCNGNSVVDHCELVEGSATDCNGNDLLDECESSNVCSVNVVRVIDHFNPDPCCTNTNPCRAIGAADAEWYSMGSSPGWIEMELGFGVSDVPGPDLVVWEESTASTGNPPDESAQVSLSTDGSAWTTIGNVERGDRSSMFFDIEGYGVNGAKFVRIADLSTDSSGESPGFDLDAVKVLRVDCNGNSIPDECDISDGVSEDCNENFVPDECDLEGSSHSPDLVSWHAWSELLPFDLLVPTESRFDVGNSMYITLQDGFMNINETSTTFTCAVFKTDIIEIQPSDNWAFAVQIRTNSHDRPNLDIGAGSGIDIETGRRVLLLIARDAIGFADFTGLDEWQPNGVYLMDTADTFHLYRVEKNANWIRVFVDDSPEAVIELPFDEFPFYGDSSKIWLAETSNPGVADFDVRRFVANTTGTDLGLSSDCNSNHVPDECDLGETTSSDCNANLIPDECESNLLPILTDQFAGAQVCEGESVTLWVVADNAQGFQWLRNGVNIPFETNASYTIPTTSVDDAGVYTVRALNTCGEALSGPIALTVTPRLAAPLSLAEPSKNRYLSLDVSTIGAQDPVAIRVTPTALEGFTSLESRWAGEPDEYPDGNATDPERTIWATRLQCEPLYADWSQYDVLHVFGGELVPGSSYEVQTIRQSCSESVGVEEVYSLPGEFETARWGDVAEPYHGFGTPQPDFNDISAEVSAFLSDADSPGKARAQLQPDVVFPNRAVDFRDISDAVSAFLGDSYSYNGPCVCPSSVECGAMVCASDSQCMDGFCIDGFCTDWCGRCSFTE